MSELVSVCVFCGSSPGARPIYAEAASRFGVLLAEAGIRLVYGGGNVGLMGKVADAVMTAGGEAIGVIPRFLMDREVGHTALTEIHVVDSMHERKAMMAKLSDGFAILPGGIGTLEEMFEVWTWRQLGLHPKPCAVLNVGGYYDRMVGFLDDMVTEGFLQPGHRAALTIADTPEALLAAMRFAPAPVRPNGLAKT